MKISVISAAHGQTGNTVSAITIAHALSLVQHNSVCVTHTNFGDTSILNALGAEYNNSATSSFSIIIKLLEGGLLKPEDLPNYSIKVFEGLHIYTSDEQRLDEGQLLSFYDYLLNKMYVYGHIVVDVDSGRNSQLTQTALAVCDTIVIPVTQNVEILKKSLELKKTLKQTFRKGKPKNIHFLLNHYNPTISSYKKVAEQLKVRPGNLMILKHAPLLVKDSNDGKLSVSYHHAVNNKGIFFPLKDDMNGICKVLLGKDLRRR